LSERLRCPLCSGGADPTFAIGDRNRELSEVVFRYRRCRNCGTLFLENVPADLGRYYPDDYYALPSLAELDRAAAAEAPKIELIAPYVPSGRLVDIGAAYGIFARAAKLAGYHVTAIEMDERCCGYLRETVGVQALQSAEPEQAIAGLEGADAIVLWHVLEHLSHPAELLANAATCLEPGGVLALAMPNPDSLQFRLLGASWAHVDAPRHLALIPFAALRAQAEGLGFELAHMTTSDPAGRHWNTFGWEYALRRRPARHRSTVLTRTLSRSLGLAVSPLERRGLNGSAYTAVFVKR
jgi:2-polyprenyl-3-methyl-5-hydroxy-6-metoxy-1,4-benzoquinol methylase